MKSEISQKERKKKKKKKIGITDQFFFTVSLYVIPCTGHAHKRLVKLHVTILQALESLSNVLFYTIYIQRVMHMSSIVCRWGRKVLSVYMQVLQASNYK